MNETNIAHPPETIEGWYALHQIFRSSDPEAAHAKLSAIDSADGPSGRGWTRWVRLIGSPADLMGEAATGKPVIRPLTDLEIEKAKALSAWLWERRCFKS